jgi:hypothetical protein
MKNKLIRITSGILNATMITGVAFFVLSSSAKADTSQVLIRQGQTIVGQQWDNTPQRHTQTQQQAVYYNDGSFSFVFRSGQRSEQNNYGVHREHGKCYADWANATTVCY